MTINSLERAGIILNVFAGILFGLNYFISDDQINWINNCLTVVIDNIYNILNTLIQNTDFLKNPLGVVFFLMIIGVWGSLYSTTHGGGSNFLGLASLGLVIFPLIGFCLFCLIYIVVLIIHPLPWLSPKGFIGSLAIILFITGSALQLKATYACGL